MQLREIAGAAVATLSKTLSFPENPLLGMPLAPLAANHLLAEGEGLMLNLAFCGHRVGVAMLAALLLPGLVGAQCLGDFDRDDSVSVDELVTAVQNSLLGCAVQPRIVDNGDGTVTDRRTGLMWEKKALDGGLHDLRDAYTWSETGTAPDGSAFTEFLPALNACVSEDATSVTGGFAGYCDWRLPNIAELRTILDCRFGNPCIDPNFGISNGASYWSSTTTTDSSDDAWSVDFDGFPEPIPKVQAAPVRGVRAGH